MRITTAPEHCWPVPRSQPARVVRERGPSDTVEATDRELALKLELLSAARQAYLTSEAERAQLMRRLRQEVASNTYQVDIGKLCDTLLGAIFGGEHGVDGVAQATRTGVLQPETVAHALRGEAQDYDRLAIVLRTVRRLAASNDHEGVRKACDGLLLLTKDLEQRAGDRVALCGLKKSGPGAEEELEGMSGEVHDAYVELYEAQLRARAELAATQEALSDLRAHIASLRAVLGGGSVVTYDEQGRASPWEAP